MHIKSAKLTFRLSNAGSLKDKRRVARGIMDRTRNKFNASVAEVARQDTHGVLVIGITLVAADHAHATNCIEEIIRFMDDFAEIQGTQLMEVEEF